MAELSLFIGKGGVGKTTVSAAYAVHVALQRSKESVLLLSTDPAHSLADVFQRDLPDKPIKVPLARRANLSIWQVNAEKEFLHFLHEHRNRILSILESGSIFSRKDIERMLDTTLPGMAEMSALVAISEALRSGRYDRVIVDTAPLGHTLRLFELPASFSRFLDFLELASRRDEILAAHFGGIPKSVSAGLLSGWRNAVDAVEDALAKDARIYLVTTPEVFAQEESRRAIATLRTSSPSLEVDTLVLNRVISSRSRCRICRARFEGTRVAKDLWRRHFPRKRVLIGEDTGGPVLGAKALAAFGAHVFSRRHSNWQIPAPDGTDIDLLPAEWPVLDRELSFVLGKGGVGKTTISAGLGFYARKSVRTAVEICSVDPAPSLDDIFQTNVGDRSKPLLGDTGFRASELDASRLFKEWASNVKNMIDRATTSERSAVHLDLRFEREMFSLLIDSMPPGLDEVLAVLRIEELLASKSMYVVVDMAPTGHALELLRTPARIMAWTKLLLKSLAEHRTLAIAQDAAVKVAELGRSVRGLSDLLANPRKTCIYTVMLPETLPDRETERLVNTLRAMGLAPAAIFVNRVLFQEDIGGCPRCRRARKWQLHTLSRLKGRYEGCSIYILRNFAKEIAGKSGLRSLTGELWRLA